MIEEDESNLDKQWNKEMTNKGWKRYLEKHIVSCLDEHLCTHALATVLKKNRRKQS